MVEKIYQLIRNSSREDVRTSRGQILIMFGMMIFLLFGIVSLAVDAGFLMGERRQVQNAADAGALAAARAKLDYLAAPNRAAIEIDAGKRYGAANAEVSEDNVDVDPVPGPQDEFGEDYVRVVVEKEVDTFFLRAFIDGPILVSAEAVAGIEPVSRPYALLALDCGPSGLPGIYINGSGTVNVNQGSIMSNCSIGRAGNSNIVLADGSIDYYGSVDPGPLWHAGEGYHYRNPAPDPVAQQGTPPPSRSAAQSQGNVNDRPSLENAITNLSNLSANSGRCPNNTTCVMQPGYYGGNMTLDVRGTLQMQPGIYYFGDNFRFEGQSSNARINGTNVMLYFTDNARFDPGNARVNLSAAAETLYTDGIDGMVLWIANCTPFLMQSNGEFILNGVLYAPCSQVRLYGTPGNHGMQVIVGHLEMAGTGAYNILFTEYVRADVPQVFLVR